MPLGNLAMIFVVVVLSVTAILYLLRKKKTVEVEGQINVDDKTYTLELMIKFVKRRLDEITKVNLYDIGLSEEELKRRKNKSTNLKKL